MPADQQGRDGDDDRDGEVDPERHRESSENAGGGVAPRCTPGTWPRRGGQGHRGDGQSQCREQGAGVRRDDVDEDRRRQQSRDHPLAPAEAQSDGHHARRHDELQGDAHQAFNQHVVPGNPECARQDPRHAGAVVRLEVAVCDGSVEDAVGVGQQRALVLHQSR